MCVYRLGSAQLVMLVFDWLAESMKALITEGKLHIAQLAQISLNSVCFEVIPAYLWTVLMAHLLVYMLIAIFALFAFTRSKHMFMLRDG